MLQSLVGLGLLAVVCVVWFGNRIMIEEEMLGSIPLWQIYLFWENVGEDSSLSTES
jgi:hypothetical protein